MNVKQQEVLRGVRVVDFSWVMAGPMSTKMLALMGAEVIKVESGDRPEYANRGEQFAVMNNNKRSCSINITTAAGQDLVRRLVAKSDVLVENFSARVLAKSRLSYEELRTVRPELIFVSASGVGRHGPQRDALAYGTLLQGYAGRFGIINKPHPSLERIGITPAWTDPVTAMWETLAILAAIYRQRKNGTGAYVDLSMLESTVALLPEALLKAALGVDGAIRGGNNELDAAPSGCFRCAGEDEWLALSVRKDVEWEGLCEAIGRRDLLADSRFAGQTARLTHKSAVNALVADWLLGHPAREAETLLQNTGVPAARSRNIADVVDEPHFVARKLFPEVGNGRRTISLPWRDATSWRGQVRPAPELGADNHYVFGELLGLREAEIRELAEAGVIH